VLDEQDGEALGAVELAEHFHHLVAFGGPQAGHHFVEQQQMRARGERARHLEALAVRQRQGGGGQLRLRAQAELVDDPGGDASRRGHVLRALQRADDHVVEHRQPGERLDDLEGAPDAHRAHLVGPQPSDGTAPERDRALVRRIDAGDHVEHRRLAGAVRPDEPDDGALADLERSLRYRLQAAEGFRHAGDFEHHFASPRRRASAGQMPCGRNMITASSTTP
jgi:hypothetical protein